MAALNLTTGFEPSRSEVIYLSFDLCYGQPHAILAPKETFMSEFGERLILLREKSKLSLKEICEKVGIPPSRLVELERGVRIPTTGQIEHLEIFYGVNSGELSDLAKSLEAGDW